MEPSEPATTQAAAAPVKEVALGTADIVILVACGGTAVDFEQKKLACEKRAGHEWLMVMLGYSAHFRVGRYVLRSFH